ncbi:MAG: response regulator [Planctomycetota bacterium]
MRFWNKPKRIEASTVTTPLRLPRILLAEDSELVARSTMQYLRASGFQVELASTGHEVLERSQQAPPELILMDIQMPGMDGLECIERLRKQSDFADLPIIAMTGLAMEADATRCLESGANYHVSKPCRMKDLVTLIRQLLTKNE